MSKIEQALAAAHGVNEWAPREMKKVQLDRLDGLLEIMSWEEKCEFFKRVPKRCERAVSKLRVQEAIEGKSIEELTARGMGVELGQYCLWAGLSASGTSRQKAERLIEWGKRH